MTFEMTMIYSFFTPYSIEFRTVVLAGSVRQQP